MTAGAPGAVPDADVGSRVVQGGFQRSAGFVATNLLSVAGAVLLLRYLGLDDFGRFGVVMALVNVVYGISDAGLSLTGSRELAILPNDAARRTMLSHLLAMRIALTGVGVAVAVGFATLAGYDSELVEGTAVAGVGIFLASVQAAMLLPLNVELRNSRIAINEVLRQAVLVAAFAVLAVAGAGLVAFFAAQVFAGVVLLLATLVLLERRHFARPRWSSRQMRALLAVALPIAIANVLGIMYLRILVILMSLLSDSEAEVGNYVTSTRVVELVAGLPFLLVSVVLPVQAVAALNDPERVRYITARMTETMAVGGILIALFVSLAADPIIRILGGAEYAGAVPVLQIQCLAIVTIFLAAAWNPAIVALGHAKALVATTGTGVVVVLVAGFVLIPRHEAQGAAVAAALADLALCAATYVALRRASPDTQLAGGRLGRIAAAAVPAIAVGLVPGVPDAVSAVVASAVFVGAALAFKAVPGELLDGARALLQRRSATSRSSDS